MRLCGTYHGDILVWNHGNVGPIKSTLKKALDYIENPDKTDGKLFVSSYGCSYETADPEFQMLLDQAYQKGNNLATT